LLFSCTTLIPDTTVVLRDRAEMAVDVRNEIMSHLPQKRCDLFHMLMNLTTVSSTKSIPEYVKLKHFSEFVILFLFVVIGK
jgi:hypothetical protein